MKQLVIFSFVIVCLFSSCGNGKNGGTDLKSKLAQLEILKSQKTGLDESIDKLEKEIQKLDTAGIANLKTKLVAIKSLQATDFIHFIELQGHVDAENVSYITPRGGMSQIKAIYVKQGDMVKKGQLLLKLDDAILQQSVKAQKENLETIKTQLSFAQNVYQRQKNLWDQNIGTEVQLISAKNNVNTLENQLKAAQESVKVGEEQLRTAMVYSDVDGIADLVSVKVGEIFGAAGTGVIKVVNNSILKVTSNMPENYIGSVSNGTPVVVELPDAKKTFNTTISFIGASIDNINRGYTIDAKLPSDPALKPNQIALMKIKDYAASNALVIPLNILQNDEKGKFVMVAINENGKLIARKRPVTIGLLSGDQLEVKTGLAAGEVIITEGYAGLYEGQVLKVK